MKHLVVAAHPDDEVLGCGGTMARLARRGDEVHVVILGEGITSRHLQREQADSQQIAELHSDSQRVIQRLGASGLHMWGLPDNRFDTVALLDVVKQLEELVDQLRPTVVYTQHGGDLNIDHEVTFRAVLTATRPMEGCYVKKVLAYEVASSTEWAFGQFSPRFTPQVYVDITETLEDKIAAMELYQSESRAFPHPRSPEALRAIATRWGSQVGLHAAEVFQVIRDVQ